jgi:hypothetical protein
VSRIKRFDYKFPGMRKPDSFVVYPRFRDEPDELLVQGNRAIVRVNLKTHKGMLNCKGSNPKYSYHLLKIYGGVVIDSFPMDFIVAAVECEAKSGDEIGPGVLIG